MITIISPEPPMRSFVRFRTKFTAPRPAMHPPKRTSFEHYPLWLCRMAGALLTSGIVELGDASWPRATIKRPTR